MYYALFNGILELLITRSLPPSLKLDKVDVKILFEHHQIIPSESANHSLQGICSAVHISCAPGSAASLRIGRVDLKLHMLVDVQVAAL